MKSKTGKGKGKKGAICLFFSFLFIFCLTVCAGGDGVRFVDVTEEAGVEFVHRTGARGAWHYLETMGSGCALFDFDGDGDLDLYLVSGTELSGQPAGKNALYRNEGEMRFADVTGAAGVTGRVYGMGCTVGDTDNDGDLDLYVTGYDANVLYLNGGAGTFEDVTSAAGVAGGGWSAGATFLDMDLDGDLDLYVVRYLTYDIATEQVCEWVGMQSYCDPSYFKGAPDLLYRNDGNGTFTDVSFEAGVSDSSGKGMGVVSLDYDGDGDTDLYVANDTTPNFLYRNQGGRFEDVGLMAGCAFNAEGTPQAGMGIDVGDVDGNGRPDLFVTNFSYETNAVYRNEAGGFFMEASVQAGVAGTSLLPLGFGTNLFDCDNDGDLDLLVVNGHIFPNIKALSAAESYAQADQLFLNEGGRFGIPDDVGLPAVGRGSAVGDLDGDGDLDLVVSNSGERARVFRNEGGNQGHWVELKLVGGMGRVPGSGFQVPGGEGGDLEPGTRNLELSNRDGIGAVVRVVAGGQTQVREVRSQSSYLSVSDLKVHFGLGEVEQIDRLEVRWPGGRVQVLENVAADREIVIEEIP